MIPVQFATLTAVAQGEIGRGFPYGNDGGWSGLFTVIVVGVCLGIAFGVFWFLWQCLRLLLRKITGLWK